MNFPQPPLRPLLLALAVIFTTAAAAPERLTQPRAIAALTTELQKEAADGRFSGAVLVARVGVPIFEAAYGQADRDKKVRNTPKTRFRFGSMGKMFTGVAILQLVQAGKIGLADPVSKYLPAYPNKEVAAVSVYQLLTHTGGTGDIFGPEFDAHRLELKELSDYVVLYGRRGVEFPPGSRWEYSNYGMVLLGRIIEVVSGQSYYDYVRAHIFKPAGMSSTDNLPEDQHVAGLSVGYTRGGPGSVPGVGPGGPAPGVGPGPGSGPGPGPGPGSPAGSGRGSPPSDGPLHATQDMLPYRGTSAGGGYSTVGDFLKFVNALNSNTLLDAHYTELLTTGKVVTPRSGTKYAFGFEEEITPDGVRLVGHGGGSPGMNGRLSIFPASGYVVVVFANLDPPAADNIARFIGDRLPVK
jgi:CubicO group peptidase (beta-lactamase class C family)